MRRTISIAISVLFLIATVRVLARQADAADPKFRRPINTTLNPVYSAYYDDDASGSAKNYLCGTDTVYNRHTGTDFRATVGTPVYAGAVGGLYERNDNCNDTGYIGSTCGGGYGNYVKIDHEGNTTDGTGWVTLYGHMKKGSIAWYQSLMCGAQVGLSASSGNSSGPHLHFEVRKYSYPYNDPFAGSCSGSMSFWVNQNGGVPTTQCQ